MSRAENWIKVKEEQQKQKELQRKEAVLINAGLYEKVYRDELIIDKEYPYIDHLRDENGKDYAKAYKKVAIDVTDEEYKKIEELSGYSNLDTYTPTIKDPQHINKDSIDYKQLQVLNTIKNCLIFITVVIAIGLLGIFIGLANQA